jgi:hypothetical protein
MTTTASNSSSTANRSRLDTNYGLFVERADTASTSANSSERDDLLLRSKAVLNMLDCAEHPNSHSEFSDDASTKHDVLIHYDSLPIEQQVP